MPRGLGRRFAPDARDRQYPMRSLIQTKPKKELRRTYRYWYAGGWWGDQKNTSQCVAYSWTHWVEDGPVTHKGKAPVVVPAALYHSAQLVDEWPGTDYDGTSVRAGAKVLSSLGWITGYHWAQNVQDVVDCLLAVGPVVVGTNWYDRMFEPDEDGLIRVIGSSVGGHAYLLDGVNTETEMVRLKNSWGRTWGHKGFAYMRFSDLARLLREDGEACIATEAKR